MASSTDRVTNPDAHGFINHFKFGVSPQDPRQRYELADLIKKPEGRFETFTTHLAQGMETIGDVCTWHVEKLPIHIKNFFKDPRVVTIVLTALALIAVQFAFYPITSALFVKSVVILIAPYIKLWAIRLTVYSVIQTLVFGYGMRSLGRFSNRPLLEAWYNKA